MRKILMIAFFLLFFVNTSYALTINFSGAITGGSLEWWDIDVGSLFTGTLTYTPNSNQLIEQDQQFAQYDTVDLTWSIFVGDYYFNYYASSFSPISFRDNQTPYGEQITGDSMMIETYSMYPDTNCPIYENITNSGGFLDAPIHPSILWFAGFDQLIDFQDTFPGVIDYSKFSFGEFSTNLDHAGTIQTGTFSQLTGEIYAIPEPKTVLLFLTGIGFLCIISHRKVNLI